MSCLYSLDFILLLLSGALIGVAGRTTEHISIDSLPVNHETKPSHTPTIEHPINNQQCCKIGEKLARKGLHCSAHHYANRYSASGKFYIGHGQAHESPAIRNLANKAAQCVRDYSLNMKKCCYLYADYRAELYSCRYYGRGETRRLCRDGVRSRYPY